MVDLIKARAADGWKWVEASWSGVTHFWLEFDGWAVDGSAGIQSPGGARVLIMDVGLYRAQYQ